MKTLELKSQETHSGYKTFLVAGTVYNFGEDLSSKGRVCTVNGLCTLNYRIIQKGGFVRLTDFVP